MRAASCDAWKPFEFSDSTSGDRSTWFGGVLLLMIYRILAMTLYLLPPRLR
jgi:Ca2+/H+ antiporter